MRFILTIFALTFSFSALVSQADCCYETHYGAISEIKDYYFLESNDFIIVRPCITENALRSEWYSCLTPKNNLNIEGDSINLLLVCKNHSEDQSEFMFVQLLNYIAVPERNMPIGFKFNKDFLRIVEFKVNSFGLIIEESETDLEPF